MLKVFHIHVLSNVLMVHLQTRISHHMNAYPETLWILFEMHIMLIIGIISLVSDTALTLKEAVTFQ